MSVLTAIFQAIAQAVTWIFPISENGHSAVFHDFSGRFTNACSQLTGIVHIGIAIGIFIALFRMFVNLFKNFFSGWNDLFHKRLDIKGASSTRSFMFMTVLSFSLFIIYLVPLGEKGNIYQLLNYTTYNGNIFGEGICFVLTGILLITALSVIDRKRKTLPKVLQALLVGLGAFFAVPTGGCSLVAAVFSLAVLAGMSEKYAIRYSMVLSVPVLIVMGIIELCTAVTSLTAVTAVLGLIISVLVSFFAVKFLIYLVNNKAVKYFAVYDIALGAVCFVVGIFEIIIK